MTITMTAAEAVMMMTMNKTDSYEVLMENTMKTNNE